MFNQFRKNNNKDEIVGFTFLDGEAVKYNIKTNEFMVLSKKGYVKTYFKPKGGKDYYERAIRRKR